MIIPFFLLHIFSLLSSSSPFFSSSLSRVFSTRARRNIVTTMMINNRLSIQNLSKVLNLNMLVNRRHMETSMLNTRLF